MNSSENPTLQLVDFPLSLPTSSHTLWSSNHKIVSVRGFWYPLSENQSILASSPALKSCCLKSADKIYQQIVVENFDFAGPKGKVVTLKGIFKIDPLYNFKGELTQIYVLENPQLIADNGSFSLFFILGAGIICLLAFYKMFRNSG